MTYQSRTALDEKTERLAKACRERGIPLTHQRRAVLEAIADRKDHPTAERVYEEVRQRLPNVSRMTVYRVLDLLVELGIITKVGHPGSAIRFDPTTERHHHLVCLRCNQLFDLEAPDLDHLELPDTRRLGFRVADYSIQFTGICETCQRKSPGSHPRKNAGSGTPSKHRR
jgi:Fur family peroxide stress response transcriptional regulator